MKIGIFIHSLRDGGAERVCSYLANYWAAGNLEVVLVTVAMPSRDDYFIDPNVNRISLDKQKKSKGVIDAVVSNYGLAVQLRKTFLSNDVDVAVSFMVRSNIVCSIACFGTDVFHIAAERNFSPMDNHGPFWNTLRKVVYRFPDVVVAQTKKGRDWIIRYTDAKCVEVIANPTVYPLNSSASFVGNPVVPDAYFVLAVGRLSPQKQFNHLIDAFSRLPVSLSHWQLFILGEGQERSRLELLIHKYGLSDRVSLLGRVEDVSPWYEKAKIFVLSSKYEGFPNVLAEAMSYGLAVVSYDCDTGPSELIENGKNGYLVNANDIEELSAKIEELAGSERQREDFGRNAENVTSIYSLEAIMKQWTELLPQRIV